MKIERSGTDPPEKKLYVSPVIEFYIPVSMWVGSADPENQNSNKKKR